MGVKANYFFLTHGCYNFNTIMFDLFKHLGHYTGLHVDYTIMGDDRPEFTNYYSIHRPSKEHLNTKIKFSTYNRMFFKDIAYYSDSNCKEPKKIRGNGQLLIHPLWWMLEGEDRDAKLMALQDHKDKKLVEYIESNIKL